MIDYANKFGFRLNRKQKTLKNNIEKIKLKFNKIESDKYYAYLKIIKIIEHEEETTYCLNLKHHNFMANNLLVKNCDGDEASICLLLDDRIFDMDIAWKYDLDFYNSCKEYKNPWDVAVDKFGDFLQKERQYEGHGFTQDITKSIYQK